MVVPEALAVWVPGIAIPRGLVIARAWRAAKEEGEVIIVDAAKQTAAAVLKSLSGTIRTTPDWDY